MIMKTLKKQLRLTALVLTSLIILQSCRVYHRDSVSLQQAIKEEKRVKIKTADNKTLKFKKIIYAEGGYYGIKHSTFKYEIHKMPLDQSKLQSVRMHNKSLSIIYGVGLSVVIIIIGGYIIAVSAVSGI